MFLIISHLILFRRAAVSALFIDVQDHALISWDKRTNWAMPPLQNMISHACANLGRGVETKKQSVRILMLYVVFCHQDLQLIVFWSTEIQSACHRSTVWSDFKQHIRSHILLPNFDEARSLKSLNWRPRKHSNPVANLKTTHGPSVDGFPGWWPKGLAGARWCVNENRSNLWGLSGFGMIPSDSLVGSCLVGFDVGTEC